MASLLLGIYPMTSNQFQKIIFHLRHVPSEKRHSARSHYKRQRSKTFLFFVISLFILLLVILWGQGYLG